MPHAIKPKLSPSYGVHWVDGGIALLHQAGGVSNAFSIDLPSPFPVSRQECPHQLFVPTRAEPHPQADDPLFRAMSPVPGPAAFIIRKPPPVLETLAKLCSLAPGVSIVDPFWMFQPGQVIARTHLTNCAPLVLTNVTVNDTTVINRLLPIILAGPRRVIFTTEEWMPALPGATVLETALNSIETPERLAAVGASMLTDYMLGGQTVTS